jgi:zinc transporter
MTAAARKFSLAMLLDGNGGGRDLTDQEVADWAPADGLLWIDLDLNSRSAQKWLIRESGIDPGITSILLAEETRPRSLAEADGLVIIIRGINMNPGAVPDDMVAIRMFLQEQRIVTVHRRRVLSIEDVGSGLLEGKGPKTAGQFLVELASHLEGRIQAAVENIEDLLDNLGERLGGGDFEAMRLELGTMRRQAASIRRHLAPQRDALDRLSRNSAGFLSDSEAFDLRERSDHVTRQIEDLDLAREQALVTQEELLNRIAQQQNSRMYLLSVIAAVFLPLTFVTGMLGMNVAGLPGTNDPNGFLISALVMVLLGIALVVFFKWKKWI